MTSQFIFRFSYENRIKYSFVFFAIIFRIILDYSYVNFVSVFFEYQDMLLDFSQTKYIESWFIWLVLILSSPKILNKPSDVFIFLILASFLGPLLSIYSLANLDRDALYTILLSYSTIILTLSGRHFTTLLYKDIHLHVISLLYVFLFITIFWAIYRGSLQTFNLDLTRVYDFREEANKKIHVGLFSYLIIFSTKVFLPILLALSLFKKRFFLSIFLILLFVLFFGITQQKSVLFFPLVILGSYYFFSKLSRLDLLFLIFVIIILVPLIINFVFEDIYISSLMIRRLFFLPAKLPFVYFEFFSDNEFVFWRSNPILQHFIHYPYDKTPAKVIGEFIGGNSNSNVSFFATGFMHAGIAGSILYGLISGLIFKLIDSIFYKGVPLWLVISIVIVPIRSMIVSADLATSLLTHGLFLSIIFLLLLTTYLRAPPKS